MADSANPLHEVLQHYSKVFCEAPGANRLARLASSARRVPAALLHDLAVLVQLNDPELVAADIAINVIEVAYCEAKYPDAIDFAAALRARLRRYSREPRVRDDARGDLRERCSWWRLALGHAFSEVRRYPVPTMTEMNSDV